MNRRRDRRVYAAVGTIVLLLAGLVYAWSIFSAPIAASFPDWGRAQLSLTFTVCMAFFCVGGFVGGLANGKIDVKASLWCSAVLFFAGFFLASKSRGTAMLYFGYGVLGGFASGFAYNAVMSTVSGWFPDKPGFISGILLMGFGFGSFFIGKIFQVVTPAGPGLEVWRDTFFAFGIVLMVIISVCALFLAKPSPEDIARMKRKYGGADSMDGGNAGTVSMGRDTAGGKAGNADGSSQEPGMPLQEMSPAVSPPSEQSRAGTPPLEIPPARMIRTSAFWMYFAWAVLLSAAGLALISQAGGVASEVGPEVGAGTVATVVGLISICNGIGRVIFGGMFDRCGRARTMLTITLCFIVSSCILVAAVALHSFGLIVAGFICTGFSYGGVTPTNSAFISAFFGRENYPVNFSIINMNLLIASFGGTAAGALYDASGSFISTFLMMIGAGLLALVCGLMIKNPKAQ